jgi:uncharacterized protein with HEPN domain
MERDDRAYLWDVRRACQTIQRFVQDHTFQDYVSDVMLRSAVERQFEIAGEALNSLSKIAPTLAERIPDRVPAIGMRNVLIHGYAVIKNETIWRTIHDDLPRLLEQVSLRFPK